MGRPDARGKIDNGLVSRDCLSFRFETRGRSLATKVKRDAVRGFAGWVTLPQVHRRMREIKSRRVDSRLMLPSTSIIARQNAMRLAKRAMETSCDLRPRGNPVLQLNPTTYRLIYGASKRSRDERSSRRR